MILLSLGSNLGNRKQNIVDAIRSLASHPDILVKKTSSLYETEPVGINEQPDFLNAVIVIISKLSPLQLLAICQEIERKLGRIRDIPWGPRTIDIDILIFNDIIFNSDVLVLPHPQISKRKFVLIPLAEISNNEPILNGLTAAELLTFSDDNSAVSLFGELNWNRGEI